MNTLQTCNTIALPTWSQDRLEYTGIVSYGMIHFAGNDYSQFYIQLEAKTRKNGKGRWGKPFRQHNSTIAQQKPELAELLRFDQWTQEGLPLFYLESGISTYQMYLGSYFIQNMNEARINARYFRHLTLLEEGEDTPIFDVADTSELTNWIEARKPLIKERFHATMKKFDVEYIKETIVELQHRELAEQIVLPKGAVTQKIDTFDEDCRQKSRQIQETRQLQEVKQLKSIMNDFDDDSDFFDD